MITVKNNYLLKSASILLIIILVYWILNHQSQIPISSWVIDHIEQARRLYKEYPIISVVIFCLAHFLSATLSLPGSCTILNMFSGAVFGFWKGIIIVYIITILSGCAGYYLGMKLPLKFLEQRYKKQLEVIKKNLLANDHSYLILVRLSPLLPYGALNMLFGFLKVPFFAFLISTVVGIFFDVVLLNSAGSFISGDPSASVSDKRYVALAFFILFISSFFVKLLRSKWIDFKNRAVGVKE